MARLRETCLYNCPYLPLSRHHYLHTTGGRKGNCRFEVVLLIRGSVAIGRLGFCFVALAVSQVRIYGQVVCNE